MRHALGARAVAMAIVFTGHVQPCPSCFMSHFIGQADRKRLCSCLLSGAGPEATTTPVLSAGPKYQRHPVSARPSPMSTTTLGPRIQDPSVFTVTDRRVSTESDKGSSRANTHLHALSNSRSIAKHFAQPAHP